jgi:NADH:ubiquinone oxidoreductase subunit 4 (subunit M)
MFLIISIWGKGNRKSIASFYLVGYTLIFSVFFFFCILYINFLVGTTNIFILTHYIVFSKNLQLILFPLIFLAFAVKLPLFPIHL